MNKEYTNNEIIRLIEKYSMQYPEISIFIIPSNEIAEKLFNHIITDITYKQAMEKAFSNYNINNLIIGFNDIQKICENNNATFLRLDLFSMSIIILNPDNFNKWQDIYSKIPEYEYSDSNFIEAVDLTLKHEIGHYLDWKERGDSIFEDQYNIEIPENKCFVDTELLVEDYFAVKDENNANKLGGVDIPKFIKWSKILNRVNTSYLMDSVWVAINLSDENWKRIKEFCDKDNNSRANRIEFANNVYKILQTKYKNSSETEIVDYIINNFEDLSDLPLNMLHTIKF